MIQKRGNWFLKLELESSGRNFLVGLRQLEILEKSGEKLGIYSVLHIFCVLCLQSPV